MTPETLFNLNPATNDKFRELIEQLLETNTQFNLTATRTFDLAWTKHVEDSLQGLQTGLFDGTKKVVDVGAGPGFPGLPLAMARPDLRLTFVEATGKKCGFIRAMSEKFTLNATIINARAEKIGHEVNFRDRFAVATARAVGSFSEVAEYCLPLVRVGGHVVLWRGQDAVREVREGTDALKQLRGVVRDVLPYSLGGNPMLYHLIVIEKTASTPSQFPRKIGVPKQTPLK